MVSTGKNKDSVGATARHAMTIAYWDALSVEVCEFVDQVKVRQNLRGKHSQDQALSKELLSSQEKGKESRHPNSPVVRGAPRTASSRCHQREPPSRS